MAYVCGIVSVNYGGRAYNDYDIYSDTILAKYIGSEKTLFPEKWHFGNQIYIVATPAVAGMLYPLVGDSYSAMATASCLMTLLIIGSFLWCVKPLFSTRSIMVGVLVLIGGINVGITAHRDLEGLQLFYTMASYYACYVIGIFLTLGVYNRYLQGLPVRKGLLCLSVAINFALGIQSLREMLVMNLPLCAVVLLGILEKRVAKKKIDEPCKKAYGFALVALLANLAGIIFMKLMAESGMFVQQDVLQETQTQFGSSILHAASAFVQYIGLSYPVDLFTAFRFAAALLSIAVVSVALLFAIRNSVCISYNSAKTEVTASINVLFFMFSLLAVFFAGILVLELRSVYYFCWYLMVPVCVMYLLDMKWERYRILLSILKKLLIFGVLGVSIVNYNYLFRYSYLEIAEAKTFYGTIAQQLHEDGIRYLYTDSWTERPMIATLSNDEVVYAIQSFSNDPEDLWNSIPYLYNENWFGKSNYDDAYIILTDKTLHRLEENFSQEYSTVFQDNLQLVHVFSGSDTTVYLYQGTEKMYGDLGE